MNPVLRGLRWEKYGTKGPILACDLEILDTRRDEMTAHLKSKLTNLGSWFSTSAQNCGDGGGGTIDCGSPASRFLVP